MGISYGNGKTNGGSIYSENTNVQKCDMKQYNHQGMLVCNSSYLASETGLEPMHDSRLLGYENLSKETIRYNHLGYRCEILPFAFKEREQLSM